MAASTLAGGLAGSALGLAGSLLEVDVRAAIGSLLAIAASGVAIAELLGHRVPLLQRNRETPRRWIDESSPLGWAMLNGAALGVAATSRIGFWLWYAVPLAAFLFGDPWIGALVYGAYGLARGGAPWFLMAGIGPRIEHDLGCWLTDRNGTARRLGQAALLALAAAISVGIGV